MIRSFLLCLVMAAQDMEVYCTWNSKRNNGISNQPNIMGLIFNANKNGRNLRQGDIMQDKKKGPYIIHCGFPTEIDIPLWPVKNGMVTLPYVFKWTFSPNIEGMVKLTIRYLNRILRPRFKLIPRTNEKSYVEFVNFQNKCFSKVGKCGFVGQPQPINLGKNCENRGVVAHEILHTLGFPHEQARWDRDNFVTINTENVKNESLNQFEIVPKPADYPEEVRDHGPRTYDYHSLMHYAKDAFSKNGKDTIVPKQLGISIGQTAGLSKHDVQELFQLYGFEIPAIGPLDCDFDSKQPWCHYQHTKGWKIERGKEVNISGHVSEYEDHTYGYGSFAICEGSVSAGEKNELVSTYFEASSPPYCVKFAYLMPGIGGVFDIGRLQVLVRYENGNEDVLFDKAGDQKNDWLVAEVQMKPSTMKRQLVVRVMTPTKGKKPVGDVSIDDIFFDEGMCPPPGSKKDEEDYQIRLNNDKKERNILIL